MSLGPVTIDVQRHSMIYYLIVAFCYIKRTTEQAIIIPPMPLL